MSHQPHCIRFWFFRAMLGLGMALLIALPAESASPQVNAISPAGVQRGTQAVVTFQGPRLGDATDVLFYRPGISLEKLEVERANRIKAHLLVAPDCPLGEHPVRLVTATGISELRTVWVGALPMVEEVEPNSDFDQPQPIAMNVTVMGRIDNEDVDYFVVEAKAGQRLVAEIEAMRLGRAMFDPYIAILDANRFELAAVDDTPLLKQDAAAAIVVPEDGRYIIMVRDASYGGNRNFHYRLHVGDFPRPTVAFPAGGQPGESTEFSLLGDVAGVMPMSVTLPASGPSTLPLFPEDDSGIAPSPVWIRFNDLPVVVESGENRSRRTAAVSPAPPPIAFHGVIDKPGAAGFFRFPASKDQHLEVQVYARRLGSPLDSVLNVYQAGGRRIGGNDDGAGLDSVYRFKVPEDGEYELRVSDMLGNGGPTFTYRAEVTPVTPSASVSMVREVTNRPQDRQAVAIPQGSRFAVRMRVERTDAAGPAVLTAPELPAGVTMHSPAIPAHVREVPVVFEAASDAQLGAGLLAVQVAVQQGDGSVVGGFVQDVPLVIAAPNRTVYYETQVDRLAVAVTQPAPFEIELKTPKVPVVQNGRAELEVRAARAEGFDKPITLHMLWNPPGIGTAQSVTIEPGQTTARYPINAAGNAETGRWPICIVARADTGDGELWTASQLVELQVAEPQLGGQLQMAAVEQGQSVAMVCILEQLEPFDGEATIELINLPAHAVAKSQTITKADQQVVFEITTADNTPRGQHRNLFCEVTILRDGEPIVHRIAQGGVLRVDRPRPAAAPTPAAAEKPKPAANEKSAAPAPKPLSRLEQLRQQSASDTQNAENKEAN